MAPPTTHVKRVTVDDGISVFYREAGDPKAPNILLLHGFPTSSFQFRNLIPILAEKYHVIAPDLPGYGFTEVPDTRKYKYTFENLAKTIGDFVDAVQITKYVIYIFDYGAPVGLRVMLERPGAVTAIISQNGNAYEEGLGPFWDSIKPFWVDPAQAREDLKNWLLSLETTKWQYVTGSPDANALAPETWHLDYYLMTRTGNRDIQMDIMFDYQNNLKLYPAFHKYFRDNQPPVLVVWGKNDQIFIPPGAEGFKKDILAAEVHLLDAGHFTIESDLTPIAEYILAFLKKHHI